MKSPIICIIKSTSNDNEKHCGIDSNYWCEEFLSHYKLKENIEDYVDFVKINTIYDLFSLINVVVNPSDEYIVNIEDLYYTSDYVYQAIFKSVSHTDDDSYHSLVKDSNKLATQLLGEKHMVDGDMLIIKRLIINNDFDYVDINFEDITNILRTQFLHKAVIIKPDNTITEQYYTYSPLEINFGQSHLDNSRYHEFKYLDYRLFFHIDVKTNYDNNNFNYIASMIYGKKIYGNVLLSLSDNSDSSPTNLDLTKDIILNIYNISVYYRLNNLEIDRKKYAREININNRDIEEYNPDIHKDFQHNGFPEITLCPNFFQIIDKEYKALINKYEYDMDIKIDDSILNDIE